MRLRPRWYLLEIYQTIILNRVPPSDSPAIRPARGSYTSSFRLVERVGYKLQERVSAILTVLGERC